MDKRILIVGDGSAGLSTAILASARANEITIVHHEDLPIKRMKDVVIPIKNYRIQEPLYGQPKTPKSCNKGHKYKLNSDGIWICHCEKILK